jgi:hypothetical protein
MLQRYLICFLTIACGANFALAQLPIANPVDSNGKPAKEWKVSYDANEDWPKLHYKKREIVGLRLQITYNSESGDHYGQLWLFTMSAITGAPVISGKTDKFLLDIEGSSGGRKRIGFSAKKVDMRTDAGTEKINVNGIWQCGRNKTDRQAQRIQLKINHNAALMFDNPRQAPMVPPDAAPAPSDCNDDPDTDVLEEGSPPSTGSDSDAPPTDP